MSRHDIKAPPEAVRKHEVENDTEVVAFCQMTTTELADYIDNLTDIESAKPLLKALAKKAFLV